jgi:hypothetical protein
VVTILAQRKACSRAGYGLQSKTAGHQSERIGDKTMVKPIKYFRKQADKAQRVARGCLMSKRQAYHSQADVLKMAKKKTHCGSS